MSVECFRDLVPHQIDAAAGCDGGCEKTVASRPRYRIGVIGFAHMHVNGLIEDFAKLPNLEWVACADTVPASKLRADVPATRGHNLKRAVEALGISKVYDDYREMLAEERFDIVIFCPENARHGEVAEAIALHGAHMLTEKPMAAGLSEALRMARAARHRGVTLAVNWPSAWSPAIRKAHELIAGGEIGRLLQFKWRNGPSLGPLSHGSHHPGNTVVTGELSPEELGREWWYRAADGGGALLDYCCYGAILASWMLDEKAVAVSGMAANLRSPFGDVEDLALLTVRFPSALALLEGSWITYLPGIPPGIVAYGTEGTLVVAGGEVKVYKDWRSQEPTAVYRGEPLPEGRRNAAEEFIHHLETGEPLHPLLDLELNLRATAILDAGRRSIASGKAELVNDPFWQIG